jgi:LacI family transcriptional regulator
MSAVAPGSRVVSPRLRYGEAVSLLAKDLRERKYAVGDKLPTLRELSSAMGMNHRTVRRGIEQLVRDGVLEVRRGVGVFVVDPAPPVHRRTTRIALGCRSYMFSGGDKHHPVISAYLVGAHRRFSTPDVSVQTMVYHEHKLVDELGEAILTQGINGFVVCTGGASVADVEFFAQRKIPLVHCGLLPAEHDWPVSIVVDIGATMRQGMDHLRQLGHRRIAFVAYERSADKGAVHRQFDRMVFDYQMGDVRDLHISVPDAEDELWARIEDFFDIDPFPTAVIAHDEFIADVLLAGCRRREIRVPDDLSIVSLQDGTPFGHSVPLTAPDSMKVSTDMLFNACDLLDRMIKGETIAQRRVCVVPEMVTKASTAPAALSILNRKSTP